MIWIAIGYVLTAMVATSFGLLAGSCLASGRAREAEARIASLETALADAERRHDAGARLFGEAAELPQGRVPGIEAALRALSAR